MNPERRGEVRWSAQVAAYIADRGPDTKKALRAAVRYLERWNGEAHPPRVSALTGELAGYWRLREGDHRLIFRVEHAETGRQVLCVYAQHRAQVYQDFKLMLHLERLAGREV